MCPKYVFFLLFWTLLQNSSKDTPNFLHECIAQYRAHFLSYIVFLKKVLIPDYRGLSVHKSCFLLPCTLLLKGSKDLSIFLHEYRGQ